MAVIRVNKTKNYTIMANIHLRDKRLSLRAKGLLSVMLSLPDDWNYSMDGLVLLNKESMDIIRGVITELKENGYVEVTKKQGSTGKFEYVYDIYEKPQGKKPVTEKPYMEKPGMDKPVMENPPLYKILSNEELNNKGRELNTNKSVYRFTKPTMDDIKSYCSERNNYVDPERFFNYYESNGWKVGRNPMKDWKAAVRTWERTTKYDPHEVPDPNWDC